MQLSEDLKLYNKTASRRPQSLTFKPHIQKEIGNKRKIINDQRRSTLGSGVIRQAVLLPSTENLNNWFAMNCLDFFHDLSLLWGIINYGPGDPIGAGFPNGVEYHWADGRNVITPIRCSAVQYIDHVLSWTETLLNENLIFPESYDYNFSYYSPTLKRVFTRLFRCFSIIYTSHYTTVEELNATAHMNTLFKHFMYFNWEYNIVDDFELEVIYEIVVELRRNFDSDTRELGLQKRISY